MANQIYLTKDGYKNLVEELHRLKERKPTITLEIERAREHGDLRENAEYHAAKESLTNLMRRIGELEGKLGNSRIIDESQISTETVYIGATVCVKDSDGDEFTYTLVDVEEADPTNGKISMQSPFGQALMGHAKGDKVTVKLPTNQFDVTIIKISR
ncbi:MAG: transcription elongation factor GreA [Endomicrobiales bacterium]|nr:transcription elongation factor GreA [Endomicrobiales bacterium]